MPYAPAPIRRDSVITRAAQERAGPGLAVVVGRCWLEA